MVPTHGAPKCSPSPLALQLRVPFEVGFLGHGLMAAAPDGPGDDESRFDAALDQTPGNTTDLLERPSHHWSCCLVGGLGEVSAVWRITMSRAKASMTSETWRCQP